MLVSQCHLQETNLLQINRISCDVCEILELEMERTKLGQDGGTTRSPTPVLDGTTATDMHATRAELHMLGFILCANFPPLDKCYLQTCLLQLSPCLFKLSLAYFNHSLYPVFNELVPIVWSNAETRLFINRKRDLCTSRQWFVQKTLTETLQWVKYLTFQSWSGSWVCQTECWKMAVTCPLSEQPSPWRAERDTNYEWICTLF